MTPLYALDASGVLRSTLDFSSGGYVLTPSVYGEIAEGTAKTAVEEGIRTGSIKIIEPTPEGLKGASRAASATGDHPSLSAADLDVLAVALDLSIPIISDDYAIQNVAAELDLKVVATTHDGIKRRINWIWVCAGCKRKMGGPGTCGVCGHKARRRRG
jgi:UPF0271 protein